VKRIKGKQKNQIEASLYQDMIGEMYVMSRIGLHPNIISLYGVCAGPQNDPVRVSHTLISASAPQVARKPQTETIRMLQVIIMELTLGPSLESFLQTIEGIAKNV
jgi:serine/threonine protein kinase